MSFADLEGVGRKGGGGGGGGGGVVRDAEKYLGPTPGNFKYPSDPPPGNLFWIHP